MVLGLPWDKVKVRLLKVVLYVGLQGSRNGSCSHSIRASHRLGPKKSWIKTDYPPTRLQRDALESYLH